MHPTFRDNSPYTAFSAFAGNELFIDLDLLVKDKFLKKSDIDDLDFGANPSRVDYKKLTAARQGIYKKLFSNFTKNIPMDFQEFCQDEQFWLDDYALFMSIFDYLGGAELLDWPDEYKLRDGGALDAFRDEHQDDILYYKMLQYLFFKQWNLMHDYAADKGISIIGDIPYYISINSADAWCHPKNFELDKALNPTEVAGCPPDLFCEEGQLWGNPIYNWKYLKHNKYDWWIQRLKSSFKLFDVLRIDHFRGFESYYSIRADAKDARDGIWKKGPGFDLFKHFVDELGDQDIIAEDLGYITDDVRKLLNDVGYPGMKVLQFAFDSRCDRIYLPHNYTQNSVVYIGTHDNDTLRGWIENAPDEDIDAAMTYFGIKNKSDLHGTFMQTALSSVSNTCILCIQDILELGTSARINAPSVVADSNWSWRMTQDQLDSVDPKVLLSKTHLYDR